MTENEKEQHPSCPLSIGSQFSTLRSDGNNDPEGPE
jgi:hypothetical protein